MHNKPVALFTGEQIKGLVFKSSKDLAACTWIHCAYWNHENFEKGKKQQLASGQMHGPSSLMLPISILSTQKQNVSVTS